MSPWRSLPVLKWVLKYTEEAWFACFCFLQLSFFPQITYLFCFCLPEAISNAGVLVAQMVKESALQCRRPGFHPWVKKIPWRKEWLPTPVFLPGESLVQRSLVGYIPWGHKELDMTEQLTYPHTHGKLTLNICFLCAESRARYSDVGSLTPMDILSPFYRRGNWG